MAGFTYRLAESFVVVSSLHFVVLTDLALLTYSGEYM